MQRLKILSQYKIYILIGLIALLYVSYFTFFHIYRSKYKDEKVISGRIIDYKIKEDRVLILIKGKEKVMATYYYKNKKEINKICYGAFIIAEGSLYSPKENTIPNTFNYKKYLNNNKIYWQFKINSFKISKNSNILYKFKNEIYKKIDSLRSSKYIKALVLGNKNYLDEEELHSIKANGIMHLFAVSGMHVSLILQFIDKLLKPINKNTKNVLIIFIIFLYSFIVNFSPSILRILVTFAISSILELFNSRITNLKVLLLAFILLLLINPLYILNLGFLYSFILVLFLHIYRINNKQNIKSLIKVSILTFLVSAPITIYNFYEINILSIIINIICIPIISYIIFPLCFFTLVFPIFDKYLYLLFLTFIKLNKIFSDIKILNIIIGKPNILFLFTFYLLIILYKYNKKYLKYLIINLFIIFITCRLNYSYKIIFFDVSQGDSSVIITPFNRSVTLIDTGGVVSFNKTNNYKVSEGVITYLKSIGLSKINYLVLSHGDYDHMGEAINLVNNFKVEKVIFNCGPYNDLEKELIKVLDKKEIKYYSCIKELNINNNKLYFLQTKEYDNENDNSNVIYTKLNGYNFMFMGDASITTEKEILDKYNLSDIDVLKVGHHGSRTSSSKEFINEINPKYSIISVGKNNRYGHPNKEVLNNLEDSKIYRTDEDGSIMININNKLRIETCSP